MNDLIAKSSNRSRKDVPHHAVYLPARQYNKMKTATTVIVLIMVRQKFLHLPTATLRQLPRQKQIENELLRVVPRETATGKTPCTTQKF
jgi:hypothetical protein